MKSNESIVVKPFSHIYVEKEVAKERLVRDILFRFPDATVIEINHYKDIFCRKKQNPVLQKQAQSLILAKKQGQLLYKGAPVCQNFGNENFYYTSCIMNCIYDCEYCYLQGMYPSANLVIFVNLEDVFLEVEKLLMTQSVYLCVSYDTDLVALNDLTGFVEKWIDFTETHENLRIEIRTKCGRKDLWRKRKPCKRVILAFTLSPQEIITSMEKKTASLSDRVSAAKTAMDCGFEVRLCFDPMIIYKDWKHGFQNMLTYVSQNLDMNRVYDVSIGSFRISKDYLAKLRKFHPQSAVLQYPYDNVEGYYQYPKQIREELENFLYQKLLEYVKEDKIFRW